MEIDDRLASKIHGILSSDSDSDFDGKREFDDEYNSLKPPPFDYESIRDRIILISQRKLVNIWDERLKNIEIKKNQATGDVTAPKKKSKSKTAIRVGNIETGTVKVKNGNKKTPTENNKQASNESPSKVSKSIKNKPKELKNNDQNQTSNILPAMSNNRSSGKKKIRPVDIDFLDGRGEYDGNSSINLSNGKHIQTLDELESGESCVVKEIEWAFNKKKKEQLQSVDSFNESAERVEFDTVSVETWNMLKKKFPYLEDYRISEINNTYFTDTETSDTESEAWEIPKKPLKWFRNSSLEEPFFDVLIDNNLNRKDNAQKKREIKRSREASITKRILEKRYPHLNTNSATNKIESDALSSKNLKAKEKRIHQHTVRLVGSASEANLKTTEGNTMGLLEMFPNMQNYTINKTESVRIQNNTWRNINSNNHTDTHTNNDNKMFKETSVKTKEILEQRFLNLNASSESNRKKKKFRTIDFNLLNEGYVVEVDKMTKTKKPKRKTTDQNEVLGKPRKLEYIDITEAGQKVKKKKKKTKKKKTRESAENSLIETSNDVKNTAEMIPKQEKEKLKVKFDETDNGNQEILTSILLNKQIKEDIIDDQIQLPKNVSLDDITPTVNTEGVIEASTALATNKKIKKKKKKSKNPTDQPICQDTLLNYETKIEENMEELENKFEMKSDQILVTEIDVGSIQFNLEDKKEVAITSSPIEKIITKKKRKKKSKKIIIEESPPDSFDGVVHNIISNTEKIDQNVQQKQKNRKNVDLTENIKVGKITKPDNNFSINTDSEKEEKKRKKKSKKLIEELPIKLLDVVDDDIISNIEKIDQNGVKIVENYKEKFVDSIVQQQKNRESINFAENIKVAKITKPENNFSINVDSETLFIKSNKETVILKYVFSEELKNFMWDINCWNNISLNPNILYYEQLYRAYLVFWQKNNNRFQNLAANKIVPKTNPVTDYVEEDNFTELYFSNKTFVDWQLSTMKEYNSKTSFYTSVPNNVLHIIANPKTRFTFSIRKDTGKSCNVDSDIVASKTGYGLYQNDFSSCIELYDYDIDTIERKNKTFQEIYAYFKENFVEISKVWEICGRKLNRISDVSDYSAFNINSCFAEIIESFTSRGSISASILLDLATISYCSTSTALKKFESCSTKKPKIRNICWKLGSRISHNILLPDSIVDILMNRRNSSWKEVISNKESEDDRVSTICRSDLTTKKIFKNQFPSLDELNSGNFPHSHRIHRSRCNNFNKKKKKRFVPFSQFNPNIVEKSRIESNNKKTKDIIKTKDSKIGNYSNPSVFGNGIETIDIKIQSSRRKCITHFENVIETKENKKKESKQLTASLPSTKPLDKLYQDIPLGMKGNDALKIQQKNNNSNLSIFHKKKEAVNVKIQSPNPPIEIKNTHNFENIIDTSKEQTKFKQLTADLASNGSLDKSYHDMPLGCAKRREACKVQPRKESKDSMVTIFDEEQTNKYSEVVMPKKFYKSGSNSDTNRDIATMYKENFKNTENFAESFGDFKTFFSDSAAVLEDCKQKSKLIFEQIKTERSATCDKDFNTMLKKFLKINDRAGTIVENCEEMCTFISEKIRKSKNICDDCVDTSP